MFIKTVSGNILLRASMPLYKATMFPYWHTGNRERASPTRWVPLALQSRAIRILGVRSIGMPITYAATLKLTALLGVIPRAAMALFEKLSGPPILLRNGSSGIRTPTRYSTNSVHTLQSLAKAGSERNWQLKATYVEVRSAVSGNLMMLIAPHRYTTNNYETCWSPNTYRTPRGVQ